MSGAAQGLLEREAEVGRLERLTAAAAEGRGAAVAVEGPAGIGKSRLMARAAELARERGMRVLAARGGELERGFAYGVVRNLLEPELARRSAAERRRLMAGSARLAGAALSPDPADRPSGDALAIAHGLYWLTVNLADEAPVALALDDAHWADDPSLAFLSYLTRRAGELPVLVAYATRPAEGAAAALPARADPGGGVEVLRPAPLSAQATAELARRALGTAVSPRFAQACHAAADGNPFLTRELLAALAADGVAPVDESAGRVAAIAPESVSRAIVARLDRLGRPARAVATAVACLGARGELRHVAALTGIDGDALAEVVERLCVAGILGDGLPLAFAHPVVRTAVYAHVPPARRAALQREIARMLHGEGAHAEAVAAHLLETVPQADPWVVERLRAAAGAVFGRGAPEAACAYLARARAEPPEPAAVPPVLRELGSAELAAGRPGAVAHLRAALDAAADRQTRVAAASELAIALAAENRAAEAVAVLAPVIDSAAGDDPELAMRLEADLFGAAQIEVSTARAGVERLDRVARPPAPASAGERLITASFAFRGMLAGRDAHAVADLAERALAGGRLLADLPRPESHPFSHALLPLVFGDRLDAAEGHLALAAADARDRGSLIGAVLAGTFHAHLQYRRGRLADAEAEARVALDTAGTHRLPGLVGLTVSFLLEPMLERAEPASCWALLRDTGTDGPIPPLTTAGLLIDRRARLRLLGGDARGALEELDDLEARNRASANANPVAFPTKAWAALAHLALEQRDEARAAADEHLRRARAWGAPTAIAQGLRVRGLATEGDEGVAALREAVTVAQRSVSRYEHAAALADLGAAMRRAGDGREAREPLRAALDLAHRCGATRLAGRARAELVATGARPRRLARTGLDALTAGERRVARLAADGLTNREIAETLFVTLRTVELHLTHAYRKLGIDSRDDLAAALRPEGPGPRTGAGPPVSPYPRSGPAGASSPRSSGPARP